MSELADILLTVDRTFANSSGLLRINLLHVSQSNLGFVKIRCSRNYIA